MIVAYTLDFGCPGVHLLHLLIERVEGEEIFLHLILSMSSCLAQVHSLLDVLWHSLTALKVGVKHQRPFVDLLQDLCGYVTVVPIVGPLF